MQEALRRSEENTHNHCSFFPTAGGIAVDAGGIAAFGRDGGVAGGEISNRRRGSSPFDAEIPLHFRRNRV